MLIGFKLAGDVNEASMLIAHWLELAMLAFHRSTVVEGATEAVARIPVSGDLGLERMGCPVVRQSR
jgi:hypothetical protein